MLSPIPVIISVVLLCLFAWLTWRAPQFSKPWQRGFAILPAALLVSLVAMFGVYLATGSVFQFLDWMSDAAFYVAAGFAGLAMVVGFVSVNAINRWRRSRFVQQKAIFDPGPGLTPSKGPVDIFISYKQEERALAIDLARELADRKYTVWFDTHLRSGETFDSTIERQLSTAKCILVCWSSGAVQSEWVRSEATIARQRDVLVSIMLEPCNLPPPFNLVHTEALTVRPIADNPNWDKVLVRIREIVQGSQ